MGTCRTPAKLLSLEEVCAEDEEIAGPGTTLKSHKEAGAEGEELAGELEEELKDKHEVDLKDAAEVGAAPAHASAWGRNKRSLK